MLKSADSEVEEDEDDDELVSRLSPFDEMPPSSTNSTTPTTANSNSRFNDGVEGSRRSSLARRESEDKEKSSRSVSRVSVTTTSTRGGADEFYDS